MADISDVTAFNSFADRGFGNAPDNHQTETAINSRADQPHLSSHRLTESCKSQSASKFIMMPKLFSEGISLQKEGPSLTSKCNSTCIFSGGNSYRTSASFIPKYIKKYFTTILKVDDEITYYESIEFERRTVMKNFSETINSFPKEKKDVYRPSITYDPYSIRRHYISGLELLFMRTLDVSEDEVQLLCSDESVADVFQSEKIMMIDDSNGPLVNGEI